MSNKILILDDDTGILEALELLLQDEGYETEAIAKNGEQLQRSLSTSLPDLIILDVLLSGYDGREICKSLKSHERTKHIPIIMISAHPNAQPTALQAGANAFISKPFDMDDLLATIGRHL